jgi:sugar phosphate isomerase/epimerase
MRLGAATHLCYCSNVHPGESWPEVRSNIETQIAAVKAEVSPDRPFGAGLWLSAEAARTLAEPEQLAELKRVLAQHELYVFTLNGFPYGAFHGRAIKARVYEPDWRDPQRLAYSNTLAELLAALLPDGVDGSISTLPCGFAPSIATPDDVRALVNNLLQHAAHLHRLREHTGKQITLALEPEPCCYLETTQQTLQFFEHELRGARALARMCALTGVGRGGAADLISRHIGVCLDACHAAVEFEDARELVAAYAADEVAIAKLQLSCGLRIERIDAAAARALQPYAEDVYLHQVVERRGDGGLTRHLDLPDALAALAAQGEVVLPAEWRVHFHVPVFLERMQHFGSTQAFLRELLALQRTRPFSTHLEVETYTWNVLPEEARPLGLTQGIARELRFCLDELAGR